MEIDICIFLFIFIATFAHACGPQEQLAVAPVTSIPVIPPVLLVTRIPRPPSTVVAMTVSTPAPAQIVIVPAPAAPAPVAPAPVPVAPAAQPVMVPMAGQPAAAAAAPAQPVMAPMAGQPAAVPVPRQPAVAAQVPPAPAGAGVGAAAGPAGLRGRKKRSANLKDMKKCRRAEFDVIMDHKNMSQKTSEIVEKLESKVESIQKFFNNTMNRTEIESIRNEKLKITYKVDAECNSVRHVMLDALVEIETIQSIVIKCKCQPSFVMFKKDFKV